MFRVKLLLSSSFKRSIEMPWLRRCGAFLMELMICRTPDDPCCRSRLDELNVDGIGGGCGCKDVTLLLSSIVGMALDVWVKPPLLLENKFNSLADDGVAIFDERRLRNDNDFKRLSFVDSRLVVADCFCRSSSDDTNWSKTFKSAFILEFRIELAFNALLTPALLLDAMPRRWVICETTKNGQKSTNTTLLILFFTNALSKWL